MPHKNPDERRAYARTYRANNSEKYNAKALHYQHTLRGRYGYTRSRAKQRGWKFTLTFREYSNLLNLPCFYCGGKLSETGVGLDRICSDSGYDIGNIRPCCTQCNLAKNDYSEDEFRSWVLEVVEHWASHADNREAAGSFGDERTVQAR